MAGTGTLRSTSACPASEWSSAPGSWASSATTRTATPTRNHARTTPAPHQSPSLLAPRKVVLARYARNRRLADALQQWAFCSLRGSPGAKAYYQQLRDRKIGHEAALRQLANRFVGILHGCLKTHTTYNEHTAWAHHSTTAA